MQVRVKEVKQFGLSVWVVMVGGAPLHTLMSREGANSKALEYANKSGFSVVIV